MKAIDHITRNTAKTIGNKLNVDFRAFDVEEFKDALNIELNAEIDEGEIKLDDNLSEKNLEGIARVTLAHINPYDN